MATNDTKKMTLQQKLLELQKAVMGLAKNSHADAFKGGRGYDYLNGDKLLSSVRPAMDALGLRLTMDMDVDNVKFTATGAAIIPFTFTWVDTDAPMGQLGSTEVHHWLAAGSNTPVDKAIGSAATYAERYFIMKQLHLQTDRDDTDALTEKDFEQPAPQAVEDDDLPPADAPAPAPRRAAKPVKTDEPLDFLPSGMTYPVWKKLVDNCAAGKKTNDGGVGIEAYTKGLREMFHATDRQVAIFTEKVQSQMGILN